MYKGHILRGHAVATGKNNDYLGLDIYYLVTGEVRVAIIDCLKKLISGFSEEIKGRSKNQTADHMFDLRLDSERNILEKDWFTTLHNLVTQLLFATPWDRN